MRDLIERLEKASGADQELDLAIFEAIHPKGSLTDSGWRWTRRKIAPLGVVWYWLDRHKIAQPDYVQKYTASIDAALALVEKVLPGWASGYDAGPKTVIAFVDSHDFADRVFGARYTAEAATPPLAILLALLRALKQKQAEDGR